MSGYHASLVAKLTSAGCTFVKPSPHGDLWRSPKALHPFLVPPMVVSRTAANVVLKNAGLPPSF